MNYKDEDRVGLNISNLKKGDYFSIVQYYKFEDIDHTGIKIGVVGINVANGQRTYIGKDVVEKCVDSAAHYVEEIKVSKTQLVEKIEHARDAVFTVKFTKQNGDERILVGHLLLIEPKMGRSYVYDLENKGIRLVDHRTIEYLIIKGKKYYAR